MTGINKVALITGITGQDGSYLAEFLLGKNYIVHGIKRRSSQFNTQRIDHLFKDPHLPEGKKLILHYADLTDTANVFSIVNSIKPDEIYNLGAQSHVGVSFEGPEYTANVNAIGTLRLLESIRLSNLSKHTRFYQASTSELFGLVQETPQCETTPFHPRSPYAVAKLYAHWITVNYREAYGIFACNGLLFNHESPVRGESFVTRKITRGLARIYYGQQDCLYLGNLDSLRDWGHAKDYVAMQWLMLQQKEPKDYVIATGKQHSVRYFIELALGMLGVKIKYENSGVEEIGYVSSISSPTKGSIKVGDIIIRIDKAYFRPAEVDNLLGDSRKAERELGWRPTATFEELVKEMMTSDLDELGKQFLSVVVEPVNKIV